MQNKRYWLRGGIVGVCYFIVTFLIIEGLLGYSSCKFLFVSLCGAGTFIANLPSGLLIESSLDVIRKIFYNGPDYTEWPLLSTHVGTVITVVFYMIYNFIYGAILGWIYGKVKARKLKAIS